MQSEIPILCVRLSVRPMPVLCLSELTYRHSYYNHLVGYNSRFSAPSHLQNIQLTPEVVAKSANISHQEYLHGVGNISAFRRKSPFISKTVRDRLMVTMDD